MSNKLNFPSFVLDSPYTSSDSTINVTTSTKYQRGQKSGGNNQFYDLTKQRETGNITNFRITITEKGGKKVVVCSVNGVEENGTTDNGRNKYILTIEIADDAATKMHGLANDDDGTNSVLNVIADNAVDSMPKGSAVEITWDVSAQNILENTFLSSTTVVPKEAGEDIDILNSVSLHTDGKIYKYHNVNFPNSVGIANTAITNGQTGNYTTFGGLSTGHSALTIGSDQYAENTGAITETPSSTTTLLGIAESASTIRISKTQAPTSSLSDADFEVFNDSDPSKKLDIDVSGNATGVTTTLATTDTANHTHTLPDRSGTIAHTDQLPPTGEQTMKASTSLTAGQPIFVDKPTTAAKAINAIAIGKLTASAGVKGALAFIGDGTAMTQIQLKIRKVGTPSDNFVVRFETEVAGEPSGILFDANATGSIAGGSLSTSYVIETITMAASSNPTNDTKLNIVCERSGSLDDTNYFQVAIETNTDAALIPMLHQTRQFTTSWQASADRPYFVLDGGNASVATKTDASFEISSVFFGFPQSDVAQYADVVIKTSGIDDNQADLIKGEYYYLSNTLGEVSTTAGTFSNVPVGFAVSATGLDITRQRKASGKRGSFSTALISGTATHSLESFPSRIEVYMGKSAAGSAIVGHVIFFEDDFTNTTIDVPLHTTTLNEYVLRGLTLSNVTPTSFDWLLSSALGDGTLYWAVSN